MTTLVRVERRAGQRFQFLLPVSLRDDAGQIEGLGFTQDVSSRGVFFFTDAALTEGSAIELTLQMPAEITLGESMRVRCRGHILRVIKPAAAPDQVPSRSFVRAETKIGVAVRLEGYEYLPEAAEQSAGFQRLSALHGHHDDERPVPAQHGTRPVLG